MSSAMRKQLSMLFNRGSLRGTFRSSQRFMTGSNAKYAHNQCSTSFLAQQQKQQQVRRNNAETRGVRTMTETNLITTKDESREMMALWPDLLRDLTDTSSGLHVAEVNKWLIKVLQYNVPGGKKTRALALLHSYRLLASPEQLTEENIRLARILGWCIEMLQAFFVVIDDIQDGSTTRRGMPCWYLRNDIGLAAINDGLLLENVVYHLLRMHFRDKDCYVALLETFQETTLKTMMGQCLDLLSTNAVKRPDLSLFTMDRYNSIIKYKTAYYTFVLPVTLAMHFAGVRDPEMYRQSRSILIEMGQFFQIQDDYLDVYGDEQVTGKQGTDIQEGKCSWLVVVALQRVTPQQRKILEECYGCKEPEKVARVKQLYNDLGLRNMYATYEEETYNMLNTHIQQISRGLPHELFSKLFEKIYRRTK